MATQIEPTLQTNTNETVQLCSPEDMTVEEYLTQQFNEMINSIRSCSDNQITKLRQDFKDGGLAIKDLMDMTTNKAKNVCVRLQCVGGSHMGQRFRLECAAGKTEDIFKMGRSTGKNFKDKGVSLYKDKEISTTHGKIEIRNGQVFFMDMKSTNGSLLNGKPVEAQVPLRLRENDIVTMGSTDLQVHISSIDNDSPDKTSNDNEDDKEN